MVKQKCGSRRVVEVGVEHTPKTHNIQTRLGVDSLDSLFTYQDKFDISHAKWRLKFLVLK